MCSKHLESFRLSCSKCSKIYGREKIYVLSHLQGFTCRECQGITWMSKRKSKIKNPINIFIWKIPVIIWSKRSCGCRSTICLATYFVPIGVYFGGGERNQCKGLLYEPCAYTTLCPSTTLHGPWQLITFSITLVSICWQWTIPRWHYHYLMALSLSLRLLESTQPTLWWAGALAHGTD